MTFIVDMRSDTVTKPTMAMKHAMVNSALGDDVFCEDPTVNALESKIACLLGKQAGLFVPSATMGNLIAVMVHCHKRGSEAIVGHSSHIWKYEQGNAAQVGGVLLSPIKNNPDGTFDLDELKGMIRGADIHEVATAMVAVENTHNCCGGKVIPVKFMEAVASICQEHGLALHVDGARIFNASTYLQCSPAELVVQADSVQVCFSKGLCAPVGSALVGSYHFIKMARRLRKALGGGMRQVGVLAAACIVALDDVVPLLQLDHMRAQRLAEAIYGLCLKSFKVDKENVQTNMVFVSIAKDIPITAQQVLQRLAQVSVNETMGDCKTENGEGVIVKALNLNEKSMRFVLHKDIKDVDLWLAIKKITFVFKEIENCKGVEKDAKVGKTVDTQTSNVWDKDCLVTKQQTTPTTT